MPTLKLPMPHLLLQLPVPHNQLDLPSIQLLQHLLALAIARALLQRLQMLALEAAHLSIQYPGEQLLVA